MFNTELEIQNIWHKFKATKHSEWVLKDINFYLFRISFDGKITTSSWYNTLDNPNQITNKFPFNSSDFQDEFINKLNLIIPNKDFSQVFSKRDNWIEVTELENENFYVFPYFDEEEPSIAIIVGWSSPTGNGVMYYIIFSTVSDQYYITDLQGCGDIPPEIPHTTDKWKDIYAAGQESCLRVLEMCGYNFYNTL